MARTFSETYTTTQVLSTPSADNPATVTSTGLIDVNSGGASGILGTSGFAWTLTNLGTVESIGSGGAGITLESGGFVTNGAIGSTSALIDGNSLGVAILGSAGTVSNYGTIVSTQTTGGGAILLQAGGSITNGASGSTSGLITAAATGVQITGSAGTVTNFGTIASTATGTVGGAVYLGAGGLIANYGLVIGARAPIGAGHGAAVTTVQTAATIRNLGTIASSATNASVGINLIHGGLIVNGAASATGALIMGSVYGIYAGGHLLSGGGTYSYPSGALTTVVNFGTITGGAGFGVALVAGGTITNFGTIASTGGNGIYLRQGGVLTNEPGGAITGSLDGISVHGSAGTVSNFGTIAGSAFNGVYFQMGGTVANYGLIRSTNTSNAGLFINQVTGTVTNAGTIGSNGSQAVHLIAGTVTNLAGGLITGPSGVGFVQQLGTGPVGTGTVVNSGTIRSTGTAAGSGVDFAQGGVLTNQVSGLITAYRSGIAVAGSAGTIINFGTIQNTGTTFGAAVYLANGGAVTNAATVTAYRSGIAVVGSAATITNFGTISHTGAGTSGEAVYLGAGGTVTNYGLISGARPSTSSANGYPGAIDAHSQPVTVRNFGTIANANYSNGVNLLAGGTIVNGSAAVTAATISALKAGIYIGGTLGTPTSGAVGLVFNYGTIQNTVTATPSGSVVLVSGGSVINHGLIASAGTGIAFTNAAGTIDNFGTIDSTAPLSATRGAGGYLGAGGLITNEAGAAITAVRAAVSLAFFGTTGAAATVSNSGTLLGNTGISIGAGDTGNNTIVNFGAIAGTSGIAVSLGAGNDRVVIEPGSTLQGAVGNFHAGDTFDLPSMNFNTSGTATLGAGNVLQIVENGGTFTINLDPAQNFTGDFFHLANDGSNGTLVTENQTASTSGSKLAFFAGSQTVNIGLTTDGTTVPAVVAGDFNIEVFTSIAGALASGYQASAFVPGAAAISGDNNEVVGAMPSEQLLDGSYLVIDRTGSESLQIVGNAAGGSSTTVIGSSGDTIFGSTLAGNAQLIEAIPNSDAVAGPMTVIGGAGATTVWGGANDSITGGAGAILVDGHLGASDTVAGGAGTMSVQGAAGDSILGGAGALLVNENQGHQGLENIAGGAGSLTAFDLGRNDTIGGSTGGTTSIDDSYGSGGFSHITGGSGTTGTLADGENTFIKAAAGDTVTGGTDLTLINAIGGGANVQGGSGMVTGTIAGLRVAVNTAIEGGGGDTITGGAGATYIDANVIGPETITGGVGATTVEAGLGEVITGAAGALQVVDSYLPSLPLDPPTGGFNTITGGAGNLTAFSIGIFDTITGSTAGTTFVNDTYTKAGKAFGGSSLITGGSGTVTGAANPAGGAPIGANTWIIGQVGDTVVGGSGNIYVDASSGSESVTGGSSTVNVTIPSLETASGGSAIQGGSLDTIVGGSGTLQLYINSNVGAETVNLGAGHGAAALRDIDVGAAGAGTSVSGFSTASDAIQSRTSVDPQNVFLGTSQSDGHGGTILSFVDGSTMTLAGVASVGAIKFTQ
jgi:hypothetical protein